MPPSDDPTSLDWDLGIVPTLSSSSNCTTTSLIPTDARFQGRTIVITGAGGQLGREGCIYFALRGCTVVALDLQPDGLRETYQAICDAVREQQPTTNKNDDDAAVGTTKIRYKPYVCNVTDAAAVERVVQHCVDRVSPTIELLWNNAGYQGQIAPILEQNPIDFAAVMNINVTGMFIVLQAVGKRMVAQQQQQKQPSSLSIVNTASVAGLRGTPAMVAYASSKAAVLTMTVCAAKEWAGYNIRVNALSPALIGPGPLWERQNELHAAVGPPYFADTPAAVAQAKLAGVPLQRLGTPQEVVQSLAFLLSDDASYTTGINLTVDGGMAAGLKA